MLLLMLSVVALFLGPALAYATNRAKHTVELLDGLVLVTIGGLVVLHIVPHTVQVIGISAIGVALAGFAFPTLLERVRHGSSAAHAIFVPIVAAGFIVHAFVDGATLVTPDGDEHGRILALAIMLHRLPDGLAIWSVVQPIRGSRVAAFVLCLLAVSTVVGYVGGGAVLEGAAGRGITVLQAFVAGSVLHIILHRPHHEGGNHQYEHEHKHKHGQHEITWSGVGALAGLGLLVVVTTSHPLVRRVTGELAAGTTFLTLALDAAPAILLSIVASALVHAFLPRRAIEGLASKSRLSRALRGVVLAPILPTCSCGAVPLYRTLVARGVSVTAAIALLISAPEISFPALMVSWAILGPSMTGGRAVAAVVTAMCVGLLIGRVAGDVTPASAAPANGADEPRGLVTAIRAALSDVLEHTGPWLVIGLVLAALFEPASHADLVARMPATIQVPVFAAVGIPLYVCASGATPLVAVLMHKGLTPGAAVAFFVAGPASNITTFGVLARIHGKRMALLYAASVTGAAVLCGYVANAMMKPAPPGLFHEMGERSASRIDVTSLVVVTLLLLGMLVVRGPRHLFEQVIPHRHAIGSPERAI